YRFGRDQKSRGRMPRSPRPPIWSTCEGATPSIRSAITGRNCLIVQADAGDPALINQPAGQAETVQHQNDSQCFAPNIDLFQAMCERNLFGDGAFTGNVNDVVFLIRK